jgi:hypothetical protein
MAVVNEREPDLRWVRTYTHLTFTRSGSLNRSVIVLVEEGVERLSHDGLVRLALTLSHGNPPD